MKRGTKRKLKRTKSNATAADFAANSLPESTVAILENDPMGYLIARFTEKLDELAVQSEKDKFAETSSVCPCCSRAARTTKLK